MAAEPVLTAADFAETAAIVGTVQPPVDSWTPVNLNTLPDQPPIQPNLAATGLVYPGKRHVFSGPPESAKTLAAYAILIQAARHGETGILVDFEMGAYDARQRLRELGATPDEISRILYLEPDQPATPERLAALVAHKPSLVVIDAAAGAYQLEGLDDNRRAEVERFSQLYIGVFWRNGIATILIDHVVKDTEQRGRFVIGSERKLGGADVHLGFDTITPISRGTSGHYKVTTHKDRGGYLKRGHLADLHLDSDPDTNMLSWTFTEPARVDEDGRFRPTHLMEKVSIDLEFRSEAASRNDIAAAIGGRKKFVLQAIDALVREGYAAEDDGPNRSRLVRTVRRFRENDAETLVENGSTMRPEPLVLFSSRTTTTASGDFAQPCGSSVVPGGSPVVPGTTVGGGSQVVPPLTGEPPPEPPRHTPPEPRGWFRDNGHLADQGDLAWLESIAPDDDEEDDPFA